MRKIVLTKDSIQNFLILLYMFSTLVWANYASTRMLYYLSALLLGVTIILDMVKRRRMLVLNQSYASIGLFLAISLVSCIWGVNASNTVEQCISVAINFIFAALVMNYAIFHGKQSEIVKLLCISGVLMSIYLIVSEGVLFNIAGLISAQRIGKSVGNENILGYFASLSAVIAIYYARYLKKRIYLATLPITIFVVFGSGSRMATIVLFVGMVGVFLMNMTIRNALIMIGRIALVIAALWIILNLPLFTVIKERLTDILDLIGTGESSNQSITYRQIMLQNGFSYFQSHPFTGVGLGNTGTLVASYITDQNYFYLHNNYVELLASVGIFGFVSFYSMHFFGARNIIRSKKIDKLEKKLVILLLILALVNDISNVTYYKSVFYIPMLLLFMYKNSARKMTNTGS